VVTEAPVITSVATAFPPVVRQSDLWDRFFAGHLGERRAAHMAYASTGIAYRHAAVNPIDEDASAWTTARRMERYLVESIPLGKAAVTEALAHSALPASEVGCFVVVSCTGYATPGIDILIARDLGMSSGVKRIVIGHVGCHAALPGLDVARQYVLAERRPAVVLCLELPSLHIQPPSDSLDDVVVHALFSDAASVAVLQPPDTTSGYAVLDVVSHTDVGSEAYMQWTITDLGFKMTLSRRVPDVLGSAVGPMVDELLDRHGLTRGDVGAWAVHPGGPRVLDVVADRLDLEPGALSVSRDVLEAHGNCSSATILMVLEALEASQTLLAREHVVVLAFGPGLTLAAALLRVEDGSP
jgi:alkylresorcinol/alkylpyrone synthase